MGAIVIIHKPESKCGYTFKEKRRRTKRSALTPEPYSKINSSGEVVFLTEEEVKAWVKAYYQALEELGETCLSHCEEVYYKTEEILKRTGNYRFL